MKQKYRNLYYKYVGKLNIEIQNKLWYNNIELVISDFISLALGFTQPKANHQENFNQNSILIKSYNYH